MTSQTGRRGRWLTGLVSALAVTAATLWQGAGGLAAEAPRVEAEAGRMISPAAEKAIENGLRYLPGPSTRMSLRLRGYRGNVAISGWPLAFLAGSTPAAGRMARTSTGRSTSSWIAPRKRIHHGGGPPPQADVRARVAARVLRNATDVGRRGTPRQAGAGCQPDRQYPERRGRVAVSTAAAGRRHLRDDLPGDGPPRCPECRDRGAAGDDRQVHRLRSPLPESGRRIHVHGQRRRKRVRPLGGGRRRPAQRRGLRGAGACQGNPVPDGSFCPARVLLRLGGELLLLRNYYAVQAMWRQGGTFWQRWYPAIRDELVERQRATAPGCRRSRPNTPPPCRALSSRCPTTICRSFSVR